MLGCMRLAHADEAAPLERGAAIIEPTALRELDRGALGLRSMLTPSRAADAALTDADLFALPAMVPVRKALDARFVLAGVVNRMDRAYADPAHCGEVRLIYRLVRTALPVSLRSEVSSQ